MFRSRFRPDAGGTYERMAEDMLQQARAMPGFVDFKSFSAPDGERLSLITFASRAAHDAWRDHAGHRRAQEKGRSNFYSEYLIQVCQVVEQRSFSAGTAGGPEA